MRVSIHISRGWHAQKVNTDMPDEHYIIEAASNKAAAKWAESSMYEGDLVTVASEQGVEQYRGRVRAARQPDLEITATEYEIAVTE